MAASGGDLSLVTVPRNPAADAEEEEEEERERGEREREEWEEEEADRRRADEALADRRRAATEARICEEQDADAAAFRRGIVPGAILEMPRRRW